MSLNPRCLKDVLDNTPLTIDALAEKSGVSKLTIAKYLKGDAEPGSEPLVKIADFLALPLDILYGRCTEEEYNAIMKDYNKTFMQLRKAPYESYILSKSWKSDYLIEPYNDSRNLKYESPWPYNLIDKIHGKSIEYKLDPDHERGLNKAISCLNEKEQKVIHLYFEDGLTLRKVGEQLGVSSERIRQLLAKAVRRLRNPHFYQYIKYGEYGSNVAFDLKIAEANLKTLEKAIDEKQTELDELTDEVSEIKSTLSPVCSNRGCEWDINNLDLSVRSYNCLRRANCDTVEDVVQLFKAGKARHMQNFGVKSCKEVLKMLSERFDIHMTMEEVWV